MRKSVLRLIAAFCAALCSGVAHAQKDGCSPVFNSTVHRSVYAKPDQMPEFPGGRRAWLAFFSANFRYPDAQGQFQGRMVMEFVVDTNGVIACAGIRGKRQDEITLAEKEALRVLELSPPWIPGRCGDSIVPVRYVLPIEF